MTTRRSIVTISINERGQRMLLVANETGDTLEMEPDEDTTLKDIRLRLAGDLREFKDLVGLKLVPPHDNVRTALGDLYERTLVHAGALVGNLGELRDFFVAALSNWQTVEDVPLVEVEGPAAGFPFELLPVFDHIRDASIEDIEVFARRFLGFTVAVRRVPRFKKMKHLPPPRSLQNVPRLPVNLAWHAKLKGAQLEREFFEELREEIEVSGPWPSEALGSGEIVDALTNVLFDSRRRFGSDELVGESQIQHFACHCDTEFPDEADYELSLSAGDGAVRAVTLRALNSQFEDRAARARRDGAEPPAGRPLVFLNACGSAHLAADSVSSWPKWFLSQGHLGVIGTETLVPDAAAAHYTKLFYTGLLRGLTLGEAMVVARRQLLHAFGNPLGLLYVLYADPDITVEKPRPQEAFHG
jgi:hypothetical protein